MLSCQSTALRTQEPLTILGTMGPTKSFVRNVDSKHVYGHAVLGAALLSVGHCSGGIVTAFSYILMVQLNGKLSLYSRLRYDDYV
jgi:hypothetical protein